MKKLTGFVLSTIFILSTAYAGYEQGGYYQVDNDSEVGGAGNVTGVSSSVNNEIALFSGTTGKKIKRATQTGIITGTSGVIGSFSVSSGLASALSDETGTGMSVFNTSPTFTGDPTVESTYAADRMVNGDFGTSTGWTIGANWSISGGVATHTAGSTATLSRADIVGVVGQMERLKITISGRTAGSITLGIGGQVSVALSTNAVNTIYLTSTTNGSYVITPSSTFDGSVDVAIIQAQTLGKLTVDGGITINNGQILVNKGNVSYPSISFTNAPTTGLYTTSGGTLSITTNGVLTHEFGSTYFVASYSNNAGLYMGASLDVALTRNSANFLEMRNSTNNQAFGIDETYTDASNYSRLKISATGSGADFILDQLGTAISTRPFRFIQARTLSSSPNDEYAATIRFVPTYSGAFTVTRHNYMDMNNVTNATGTITDACVIRFDAAAGTHKAIDAGTTKTTPGTVDAWLKFNINGTIYYVSAFLSKTN